MKVRKLRPEDKKKLYLMCEKESCICLMIFMVLYVEKAQDESFVRNTPVS